MISEPERWAAWTTRVPAARAAIERLRSGKCQARGMRRQGNSETTAPRSAISPAKPGVALGVVHRQAAAEHGDGAALRSRQGAAVRRRVDAAGEAGDDGDPGRGQGAGEELGRLAAVGVRPAGADDGHGGAFGQLSPHGDHRRRGRELEKAGRVAGVLQGQDAAAQPLDLRGLAGGEPGGPLAQGQGLGDLGPGHAERGGQPLGVISGVAGSPALNQRSSSWDRRYTAGREISVAALRAISSSRRDGVVMGLGFLLFGLHSYKERKKRLSSLISSEKAGLDGRKPAPSRVGRGSRMGGRWAGTGGELEAAWT